MRKRFLNRLPRATLWVAVVWLSVALFGCQRYQPQVLCSTLMDEPAPAGWTLDNTYGTALHDATRTMWYRCMAGERYQDGQCTGATMELNRDDAFAYAQAISESSGRPWRLPTLKEMQQIRQSGCENPSVHPALFPSVQSNNHWTSSVSRNGRTFGCATNTFNGNGFCRLLATELLPFLMVIDQP